MMDFFRDNRKRIFIGVAIALVIVAAITGTYKRKPQIFGQAFGLFVVPVQNAAHNTMEGLGGLFQKKQDTAALVEENEALKAQVAALTDENKRLALYEKENIELSRLLNIHRKYPDYEKLGVQIISKDTSNWYNVFTIDRGKKDGIAVDMFVVAEGGLVGRVFEVSDKYAKVMTIIDDRSAVHGQSRQSDDIGVVRGDSNLMQQGLCLMEYIDLEAKISVGDEVITSVFSEMYPAGIIIGYVKEIQTAEDGLTKSAIITTGVDFDRLDKGIVLLNEINQ